MFDYNKEVISELGKYKYLAEKVESGDFSLVDYKPAHREDRSDYDENSDNRKRLLLYLAAFQPERITEGVVKRLFIAETESRCNDSFGGIGTSLEMLTAMLLPYNKGGIYNHLFAKAKNANYDCFCGYAPEQEQYSFEKGTEYIRRLTPEDCICYMYYDLSCEEKTIAMLDAYEEENKDFPQKMGAVCYINKCLGRKEHNFDYYASELNKALEAKDNWKIASCYSNLIDCCMDTGQKKAYAIFNEALPFLYKVEGWDSCGLGRNYMAYAARFALLMPEVSRKIWRDWRDTILAHKDMLPLNDMEQYYRKASRIFNDTEAEEILKKEYDLKKSEFAEDV